MIGRKAADIDPRIKEENDAQARNILPVGNRGGIFAPKVPILDFDRQIDTAERGERIDARGDRDGYAVVLKNHGVVCCGDSRENACIVAFALEESAQLQWLASALRKPQPEISPARR